MIRVVTNVTITQRTQIHGAPKRNKTLIFGFVNSLECSSTWRDLTNKGKVIVPKHLYIRDQNDKLIPIENNQISGFSDTPLLLRGDKVTMDFGYKFYNQGSEVYYGTDYISENSHLFSGYISEVTSKKPITFKVEDNMWLMKQIPCKNYTFKSTDTLEKILTFLLEDYNKTATEKITVNQTTSTTIGQFRTGNETIAEFLGRLQKHFHFESFFIGNTLYCGSQVYSVITPSTHTFTFQFNIISDELQYKRRSDLSLSLIAYNKITVKTGKLTKDGHEKTKTERIEVLISLKNGEPTYFIKQKGENYPPNTGGERMTLPYPGAKTVDDLKTLGLAELKKYYYSGFKGKFTTFGMPYVKFGDNVKLVDNILPERNGTYKVKGVEYSGGVNGNRQVIELDYKINE